MKMRSTWAMAVLVGTASGVVFAGPVKDDTFVRPSGPTGTTGGWDTNFSDNFDSYTSGTGIIGQGGWVGWDLSAPDAIVDNAIAASPPNSLLAVAGTDVVQVFDISSGKWQVKAKTYMPTGATGTGYFIMLDTFSAPYVSGGHWTIELGMNAGTGVVTSVNKSITNGGPGNTTTPLIKDQWVEVVVDVDLDTDTFNLSYGGVPLVTNGQWSWNASSPAGAVRIQAIDLYSTAAGFRWDDVSVTEVTASCYANCDGSTGTPILNTADFGCFLTKFAAGDPYANCDGSTGMPTLNVADFGCFLTKFAAGCR